MLTQLQDEKKAVMRTFVSNHGKRKWRVFARTNSDIGASFCSVYLLNGSRDWILIHSHLTATAYIEKVKKFLSTIKPYQFRHFNKKHL